MEAKIFKYLRDFIYDCSGISLGENKQSLVSARLSKRMRILNIPSYNDYINYLENDTSGEEIVFMLDAISTNVTSFFREEAHFEVVKQATEKWIKNGQRRLRVWSAGCSSGEEPYTLAMTLFDYYEQYSLDLKILATDLSTRMLDRCMKGEYAQEKVSVLKGNYSKRFFKKVKNERQSDYVVSDKLKKLILFKRLNLSVWPFPMKGPMDFIFCRNVMIYFDKRVRQNLLGQFHRLLKPGGFLFVGHSESITGMLQAKEFKTIQASVYQKL